MITQKQFKELQKFRIGSFAIWNPKGIHNADYFKKNIKKLHGNVIFLGLNRSGDSKNPNPVYKNKEYGFSNFHPDNHKGDKVLESIFKDFNLNNLNGAYITDLYQDFNGKSKEIKKKYSKNPYLIRKNFITVYNQISIFKKNQYNLICFGVQVFKDLSRILLNNKKPIIINKNIKYFEADFPFNKDKVKFNVYKVHHYSNRFIKEKLLYKILSEQLLFLNKHINKSTK